MASLLRTRLVPRLTHLVVVSRPLVARPMMALVKREEPSAVIERIEDIVVTFTEQQHEMKELQQQVQELEEENVRLRARVGDDSDDDNEISGSKIDRDSIEEKLEELEEKLNEAKELVDEIKNLLQ
jgi:predicted RNase H-like nuclease (RuvC/YqgF family)